ncbi:sensor histidine kinase [Thermophilibacter sp.]
MASGSPMLRRLRRELIAITMLLVGLVLAGVLGTALVSSALTSQQMTTRVLKRALRGEIVSASFGDADGGGADVMLAITVDVSADGTVMSRDNAWLQIPSETLADVVDEALASGSDAGECVRYPTISWMRAPVAGGWRVSLVDTYSRDASLRAQALNSAVIFAVSMLVLFVVAYLLSGLALRPVERAWEQQRRFVSDASHELKTPLSVMLANTQILEAEPGLDEETRRWVRSTREEASHMRGLVEDLLVLARADERDASGSREREAELVDLTALVSGCALEFDAVAYERGCSIECSLEDGVEARVRTDDFARVVRTLLDNATKYAAPGSVVRVGLARDGRRTRLTVNNRGEVISQEDLPHLFDRFFRTDRARQRSPEGGFGLGLAIARSIVESAGGRIEAASTERDGTTFTVTL